MALWAALRVSTMKRADKKHELTRPDKEEDRMVLTRRLNANIEPVFFTYKAVPEIDEIVKSGSIPMNPTTILLLKMVLDTISGQFMMQKSMLRFRSCSQPKCPIHTLPMGIIGLLLRHVSVWKEKHKIQTIRATRNTTISWQYIFLTISCKS